MPIQLTPFTKTLHGLSGNFHPGKVWETAKPLMDRLWETIKKEALKTEGINHWLYTGSGQIFIGVELQPDQPDPRSLERKEVQIAQYARWKHKGSFSEIQKGYRILHEEIAKSGFKEGKTSLEIYGHVHAGDANSEMEILIEVQ